MHDRSLLRVSDEPKVELNLIDARTNCILLLFGHKKFTSIAIPHSHALTQRPQFAIILLIFPDLQERLAVLQLEIVILGQPKVQSAMKMKSQLST